MITGFWPFWGSFFVLVEISLISSESVAPKSCRIETKNDVFYSPKASYSHGRIIKKMNSRNESECRQSCCDNSSCSLYMYSTVLHRHHHNISCLLIYCGNNSLCKTKPLPKNVTGISVVGLKQDTGIQNSVINSHSKNFTTNQLIAHSPLNISVLSPSPPTIHTSVNDTLGNKTTMLNSTVARKYTNYFHKFFTESPLNITQSQAIVLLNHTQSIFTEKSIHPSHQTVWLKGKHHNYSSDSIHSKMHSLVKASLAFSSLDSTLQTSRVKSSPVETVSHASLSSLSMFVNHNISSILNSTIHTTLKYSVLFRTASDTLHNSKASTSSPTLSSTSRSSSVKQKPRKKFSESQSHTTPVSLVISLIIGILFLGAVVFLIGRRWSETCFRRGYSRVDYLLNDYD